MTTQTSVLGTAPPAAPREWPHVAFVGGGNMASSILGGLIAAGHPPERLLVIEPHAPQAAWLRDKFDIQVEVTASVAIASAQVVVWAVKPQVFHEAARPCFTHVRGALHLSIMAGIRSAAIARTLGSERVIRAMPNTPALIGEGIAGLYAREAVTADERAIIRELLAPTGETLFVAQEADLDAVTALSGSGPAYVFFFLEALTQAAVDMGLSVEQGRRLAEATFKGSTSLARASDETFQTLRANVTSKGGTTDAAISTMEAEGVFPSIVDAICAAQARARELADEFDATVDGPSMTA